jgi:hypothetical protein
VVTEVTEDIVPQTGRTSAAGVTDLKAAPSLPRLVWSLLEAREKEAQTGDGVAR